MKEKVYEFLRTIPKGKVVTYGQIAEYLGNRQLARVVGNILHNNPDEYKYPCYKVVDSKGNLSKHFVFGGIEKQKEKLEEEGIVVKNYKVDLNKYKMKYEIILSNEEIENLFKFKLKKSRNLQEIIDDLENEIENFKIKNIENSRRDRLILDIVSTVGGDIKNNPKDLRCPNCNGKYAVKTYPGDLYMKLFCGTKEEKEREMKRFENMPLYNNPWPAADENTRDYWCLSCDVRWNDKDKDIIRYE